MYITIVLVALIAGATIVACKYLNYGSSREAAQDAQLKSICTIALNLKDRYKRLDNLENQNDRYNIIPTEAMLRDSIDEIYKISTMVVRNK